MFYSSGHPTITAGYNICVRGPPLVRVFLNCCFSQPSLRHYSCITYTDGSLKIRNDFQFYSLRFFFSSSLFMWPERWILCYANHFSFFYSLSLSNSILRMLCLGCPVTSPVSAIFFTVSFFSFFFPAAIRSGDGRSGWNEKGKKCFGFFFCWRAVSLVVTTRASFSPYFTWSNVFLFFSAKARLKNIRWSADVCVSVL